MPAEVDGPTGPIRLQRRARGTLAIRAPDDTGMAFALGVAHALDRGVQIELQRLIAAGRLAECLDGSERSLAIDRTMRRMGFARTARTEASALDAETRTWLEAYRDGVNRFRCNRPAPLEFRLLGHGLEPWSVEDCLATVGLMGFAGLAQGQLDAEKWLIEALVAGTDPEVLRRLFRPHLDGLDEETLAALADLAHLEPLLGPRLSGLPLPRLRGSNNWVAASTRSASGAPLQANDPHLEANRLPPVWYPFTARLADGRTRMGISMPGLPGLVMGRTRELAVGFTYGFMDMFDYFVEEVRDGSYRYGDRWRPLEIHEEVLLRKGGSPETLRIAATHRGPLEAPPGTGGKVLSMAWSSWRGGAARSLDAMRRVPGATGVDDACRILARVTLSANWLVADRSGRIGYQQSGHAPNRRHSGLHPVPGWDPGRDWDGEVDPEDLLRILDPVDGILVTANDERQAPGRPVTVNLHMGDYRKRRIEARLAGRDRWDAAGFRELQADLYSGQAAEWMTLLRPLLPDTEAGHRLAAWDLAYRVDAVEPTWFEAIWSAVLEAVFAPFFGEPAWRKSVEETAILVDYHWFFDRAILSGDACWFGDEGRDRLLARVARDVLERTPPRRWGDRNRFRMENILFAGRLPSWLGFDLDGIEVPGGRATPCQGQIFRAHGRTTSFVPGWRFVSDLAGETGWSALAGGPSGSRFSRWYLSGLAAWSRFEYDELTP